MTPAKLFLSTILLIAAVSQLVAQTDPLELVVQTGHSNSVTSMDVSPDGKYLVSGDLSGSVILWDIPSGRQLRTFSPQGSVVLIDFSPAGNWFALTSDSGAAVYDVSGNRFFRIKRSPASHGIRSFRFNSSGDELALVSKDSVLIIDLASASVRHRYGSRDGSEEPDYLHAKFSGAFQIQNSLLITKLDRVRRVDEQLTTKWTWKEGSAVEVLDVSRDDKRVLVLVSNDEETESRYRLLILDGWSGSRIADRYFAKRPAARFSPDTESVLVHRKYEESFIWHLKNGDVAFETQGKGIFSADGNLAVFPRERSTGMTDDGKYFTSVHEFRLYSTETAGRVKTFGGHSFRPSMVTLLSNGTQQDLHWQMIKLNPDAFLKDQKLEPALDRNSFGIDSSGPGQLTVGGVIELRELGTGRVLNKLNAVHPHDVYYDSDKGSYGDHNEKCIGHWAPIAYFRISSNFVLSKDIYARFLIWSINQKKELRKVDLDEDEYITMSPDGIHYATSRRGKIWLKRLETGKTVKSFGTPKEEKDEEHQLPAFSDDGSLMWKFGGRQLKCWDVIKRKDRFELEMEDDIVGAQSSPDNEKMIVWTGKTMHLVETTKGQLISELNWTAEPGGEKEGIKPSNQLVPNRVTFSPDGKYAAAFNSYSAVLGNLETTDRVWIRNEFGSGDLRTLFFSADGRFVIRRHQPFNSGQFEYPIREIQTDSLVATLLYLGDDAFAVLTPDGYYAISKGNISSVHFVQGLQYFTFENFDLSFNRPDIVLERLGSNNRDLIASYRAAYLKRLKKMGFNESDIGLDAHLPEISFSGEALPTQSSNPKLNLSVKATDSKYKLDRVNVFVNDVPIFGTKGVSYADLGVSEIDAEFTIDLSKESNKIQISTHNEKGAESLRQTVHVQYTGETQKPDLYVLAIGVSAYAQSEFDLLYAAKDAADIANHFKTSTDLFTNVYTMTITDTNATADKIKSAKDFLMKSGVDDQVIVFVAGHGLVGSHFDYYFATYNVDFYNPSENGLPYEEIENLVDGIPARKKLILMDTCHSGEIEAEDVQFVSADNTGVKSRSFRGIGLKPRLGTATVNNQLKDLFADLRRGTGAMVITSSSGSEFSFEDAKWQNGVFTYSFLEGLKEEKAGPKGQIRVSDIQDYVIKRVQELTNGRQTPTMRRENLEHDFIVN